MPRAAAAAGPSPHRPPPGQARPALVGSPGAPLALSHTCAVARQPRLSCNTSVARARMVFYFLAAPSLSLEVVEGWHLVSLLKGTASRTLPGPQSPDQRSLARLASRSVIHSWGPGPPRGSQARGPWRLFTDALILRKSSSGKLGTSTWTRWSVQRRGGRGDSKVPRL